MRELQKKKKKKKTFVSATKKLTFLFIVSWHRDRRFGFVVNATFWWPVPECGQLAYLDPLDQVFILDAVRV